MPAITEKRWHPLLEQWVIISETSAARPWSGAMANSAENSVPRHDPDCYLCPRVNRASGVTNPDYQGAFAFDNDFPSLSSDAPATTESDELIRRTSAHGYCRVLCWSHRHDATLATVTDHEMIDVAQLWRSEYLRLAKDPRIAQVAIFENKGVEIGVSNLHPHGQIYATDFVTELATRLRQSQAKFATDNPDNYLIGALLNHAHDSKQLIVESNRYWSVIVPFCARFAYETWIVPHRHVQSIGDLSSPELEELALCYQRQTQRYDRLFQRSSPNVTLLHNAPVDQHDDNRHWCFYLAFQPPLRDPQRMKFLGGFESGSNNIINPLCPENAADELRSIAVGDI